MSVRVLHVLPHKGGGGEKYIDMLERMWGFSHRRFYLSFGRAPADALWSVPLRWPLLAARVRSTDLIHCHGDVAGVIALALLRRRPSVMTTHGLHMLRRIDGPGHKLMSSAMASVLASVRAVLCTSASERDELAAIVRGGDLKKLRVIHNGIDSAAPIRQSEREAIRDQLGIGRGVVLGLFVGQLEPRKAPLLAAAAARRVQEAGSPFVLAIAGDGQQAPQVRALGCEAVKYLGHRPDVDRLLAAADVFVQPSAREGMSLALLEAMARGLAVVATDAPGNSEAVGEAGLLFRAGDEPALVASLSRLCSDPELRASIGAKARDRASDQFSTEKFLSATKAVYLESLRNIRAPGRGGGGERA